MDDFKFEDWSERVQHKDTGPWYVHTHVQTPELCAPAASSTSNNY